ncbi:MAG: CvpA family protein [Hyphomicrobiales bacterium]|nr:CvpA family protein [Hyphomicrobiales bacterium]
MPITIFDGILLAIMLFSGLLAMVRGFSREVLSVGSWIAAAAAAFYYFQKLSPYIAKYTASISESKTVADIAAAGIIFLVTLIIVSILTMKIADVIVDSRIGALDRSLGFAFGAARGLLLVVVPLMFYNWLVPDVSKQPVWISSAKSKPMLESIGESIVQLLPDDSERSLIDRLNRKNDETPDSNT